MKNFIKKRLNLTLSLMLFVFLIMVATAFAGVITAFLLRCMGIISLDVLTESHPEPDDFNPFLSLFGVLAWCVLLGTTLTGFFSKIALKPIRKVIAAIHKVAEGDFNVQVNITGIGELEELSQSFNKMTGELSKIETLRSDFVNNFSHEFKTPIVSVRGFAKLLKDGNLGENERTEYLDIIITESERLANLSTNILSLSKYENIEIVADKTSFRMDEQIRKVIVLTEPKWSAKEITVNVELDEVTYIGNEDYTQQIWINLLDNAIKFCCQSGLINITLSNKNDYIVFVIQDDGLGMDEQTKVHIFDKFYQGDTSNVSIGIGLGLALVKRIVELCDGKVEVQSEKGKGSTFIVSLPNANVNYG